jgi:hypothetical protein
MRIVCAWCKLVIKVGDTDALLISHGMCESCLAQQFAELDETVSACAKPTHKKPVSIG